MPTIPETIKSSLAGAVAHAEAQPTLTLEAGHPALVGSGLASGTAVTMCQYWPIARPIIVSLQHFLPTWTAWIVNILLSIGDKACPGVG